MGQVVNVLAFPVPHKDRRLDDLRQSSEYVELRTEEGEMTGALHIKTPSSKYTVLYSHGNAEDIQLTYQYLRTMARKVGADVFAYEYLGYGLSDGSPSETGCYRSVNAAYKYMTTNLGISPENIIAFGRSLGSGPAVEIVHKNPHIKALILQSPLESGARVVGGTFLSVIGSALNLDIFRNYEKVPDINCKILIMHGKRDQVVSFQNGVNLKMLCKHPVEPYYVEECGHNDMPAEECLARVERFLKEIDQD